MGSLGKTGSAVFKTLAAGAAIAAAAITAAAGAALKFSKSAIQAAIADDAEQQKLIATLKARGLTTEQATKRVNELIEAGQKLAFTDSETRAGIGIASQYTKNYAKQTAILTAAQNLARARNISLEAATKLVGKAFNGNGAALKAYGIDLTRTIQVSEDKIKTDRDGNETLVTTTKNIKQVIDGMEAVRLITDKNAGVAEQYAKTFAGHHELAKLETGMKVRWRPGQQLNCRVILDRLWPFFVGLKKLDWQFGHHVRKQPDARQDGRNIHR